MDAALIRKWLSKVVLSQLFLIYVGYFSVVISEAYNGIYCSKEYMRSSDVGLYTQTLAILTVAGRMLWASCQKEYHEEICENIIYLFGMLLGVGAMDLVVAQTWDDRLQMFKTTDSYSTYLTVTFICAFLIAFIGVMVGLFFSTVADYLFNYRNLGYCSLNGNDVYTKTFTQCEINDLIRTSRNNDLIRYKY